MKKCSLIITTCPDTESAQIIANLLIEKRIAACVNIIPGVQSVFHWQGQVEQSNELMLLIKSTAENYEVLEKTITSAHPYELPEVIKVSIEGSTNYLSWIIEQASK
ncbi:MAG: divalent-cation tolerance protein CutA [Gammaproteobacteria bacterium]